MQFIKHSFIFTVLFIYNLTRIFVFILFSGFFSIFVVFRYSLFFSFIPCSVFLYSMFSFFFFFFLFLGSVFPTSFANLFSYFIAFNVLMSRKYTSLIQDTVFFLNKNTQHRIEKKEILKNRKHKENT